MQNFAVALSLIAIVMLIVGLIRPKLLLFWSPSPSRLAAVGISLLVLVGATVLGVTTQNAAPGAGAPGTIGAQNEIASNVKNAALASADQQDKSAANDPYHEITLDDLKLDGSKLIDKKLRTSGVYSRVGDLEALGVEPVDTTPLMLNIDRLSRDERKALQECEGRYCTVTVTGTLRRLVFGIGIVADSARVE